MSMSEKIRIMLLRRNLSITELAERLGTTQSNLSNKLKADNFREKDLRQIAAALNCKLQMRFVMNDTGDEI